MQMSEFKWETSQDGSRTLDLRITATEDGIYKIINLKDPDQTHECSSTQEMVEHLGQIRPS